MMITPHLKEAIACLGTLKRETEWIWIDQICINQDDDLERALQVGMMKDIYTSSEGTIIWLGSHVRNIERVPPLLERLSIFYNRDMNPDGTRKRNTAWIAFGSILGRPWFVRSWVIQETALSRRLPRIFCGTKELSWQNLVSATLWILDISYEYTPLSRIPRSVPALRSLKSFNELVTFGLPWDLTTLFNKAMQSTASEPRDRVYSLLALTNEFDGAGNLPLALRANYQKPIETIFRDVTRHIISTTKSLRVLTLIRYTPDWNCLPSWVIDFSANAEWVRISYFSWDPHSEKGQSLMEVSNDAAGGYPAVMIDDSLPDHVLGLQGLQIDIIDEICDVMKQEDVSSFNLSVWMAWKEACKRLGSRNQTIEAVARAFMVTLTADWSLSDSQRISDLPLVYFWRYLLDIFNEISTDPTLRDAVTAERERIRDLISAETEKGNDENLFSLHLDTAHQRRLFFSKDLAYIGLGPKILQKNDIICFLFGGATPFILRPSGSNYRLVGECYVLELMTGEAVEGWKSGKHTLDNFHIY
ncbi:heterokaryon incompatibility protein-domain-containing protein [Fusarium flagelliforme]|uniref:Heterokaryon incompatibility protein-domain-containing protein n=1 Tax=Fusarium flagelliforme TaxID=2675880 RepID=A0A395MGG2_9HYPO|nr:heterokaryon incompatibility protein-domain-containing protein [Fusarium flagelliforme]